MYRGYVYQYLKGRYGVVIAILTGSICFSLGHIGNIRHYGLNIAFLLNVVLVGVVLALFMRRFGSIWFAFGIEGTWGATILFVLIVLALIILEYKKPE